MLRCDCTHVKVGRSMRGFMMCFTQQPVNSQPASNLRAIRQRVRDAVCGPGAPAGSAGRLRGPRRVRQDHAAKAVQDLGEIRGLRRRDDEVELLGSDQAADQEPQIDPGPQPGRVLGAARSRFPASRRAADPAGALGGQAGHRRSFPLHRPRPRRGARPRSRLGPAAVSAAAVARRRLLLLGVGRRRPDAASARPARRTTTRPART